MRQRIWLALVLLLVLSGVAQAGEYYLSDDKADNGLYWWYWDDAPKYEVKVPSKAEAYAPHSIFDERSLDITLSKNGPLLRVASVARVVGGYAGVKLALTQRWQHVLTNVKTQTDTEITTSRGVKAKFFVSTGKTPSGASAMIRLVVFVKGTDVVYLELLCDEKAYAGTVKEQWVKAVNSFNWR